MSFANLFRGTFAENRASQDVILLREPKNNGKPGTLSEFKIDLDKINNAQIGKDCVVLKVEDFIDKLIPELIFSENSINFKKADYVIFNVFYEGEDRQKIIQLEIYLIELKSARDDTSKIKDKFKATWSLIIYILSLYFQKNIVDGKLPAIMYMHLICEKRTNSRGAKGIIPTSTKHIYKNNEDGRCGFSYLQKKLNKFKNFGTIDKCFQHEFNFENVS
jgi:hypothetical protein